MPGLICGRRNDGELCISDGSGLYCRHAGPIDVLGRGCYRKEALRMERYFVLSESNKWEYVEISEAEAWKQTNVVLWEEEEPGEWWAVYREDFLI